MNFRTYYIPTYEQLVRMDDARIGDAIDRLERNGQYIQSIRAWDEVLTQLEPSPRDSCGDWHIEIDCVSGRASHSR